MPGICNSRPLHILYTNKVSPRLGGGAEARILEVGKRLVQRGHKVTVACGKTEPYMPDIENIEGMTVYNISTVPEPLLRLLSTRRRYFWSRYLYYFPAATSWLKQWLQRQAIDIWRDDISPFPIIGAAGLAKQKQVPIIATVHSLSRTWRQWCSNYGMSAGTAGYWSERWLRNSRPYDQAISASKWLQESLAESLGADKVTWIPNGVDSTLFHPKQEADETPSITILYVARFVSLKDHPTLIDAFHKVLEQEPHVRLMLVGDGPDKDKCMSYIAEKGLEQATTFTGGVAKDNMPAIYRQADIYVSTSHIEGQPLTFTEAMASGLPIISTNIRATQGVLDETNSLLFEPGAVSALADALLKLIRDLDLRRRLAANGRRIVEARFDWNRIVDEELQVYETALQVR